MSPTPPESGFTKSPCLWSAGYDLEDASRAPPRPAGDRRRRRREVRPREERPEGPKCEIVRDGLHVHEPRRQEEGDDSVHVTLYSIAVLSLCALLVGVIAAAATHVVMKQKSVQMLERSKAPWQSYGSRDEEGAPLIAKRPSLSFSV